MLHFLLKKTETKTLSSANGSFYGKLTRVSLDMSAALYHIHFPRRRINNLDMTKWKQPSNGITALIVPSGDSFTTFIERRCLSSVASLSDRPVSFPTDDKSYSIATLNWSSRLCLEASSAISLGRRSRSAPSRAATPVTACRCARASSAPTQVSEGVSHSFQAMLRFTTTIHQAC